MKTNGRFSFKLLCFDLSNTFIVVFIPNLIEDFDFLLKFFIKLNLFFIYSLKTSPEIILLWFGFYIILLTNRIYMES